MHATLQERERILLHTLKTEQKKVTTYCSSQAKKCARLQVQLLERQAQLATALDSWTPARLLLQKDELLSPITEEQIEGDKGGSFQPPRPFLFFPPKFLQEQLSKAGRVAEPRNLKQTAKSLVDLNRFRTGMRAEISWRLPNQWGNSRPDWQFDHLCPTLYMPLTKCAIPFHTEMKKEMDLDIVEARLGCSRELAAAGKKERAKFHYSSAETLIENLASMHKKLCSTVSCPITPWIVKSEKELEITHEGLCLF